MTNKAITMKNIFLLLSLLLTACATDMLQNDASLTDDEQAVSRLLYPYEPSTLCSGCHSDQYQQYEQSMHAKAFSNPLFNAQYFQEIVPRAQRDPSLVPEARKCIACHAPVVFMNYTGLVSTPAQTERFETGVTCDFCHTLAGYAANGDYLQERSGKKQGPSQARGTATHHAEYSGFVQMAEFCGQCHNATNHPSLEVKSTSTYDEWRESGYGKRGLTCQECHMNKNGFLRNGIAEFARGEEAYLNVGNVAINQGVHDKLYSHSFPGAHSTSQLEDALLLDFRVGTRTAGAGGRFPLVVAVNNERAGHKMPSGSSDLRFMWLVVTAATSDGTKVPVFLATSTSGDVTDYSIAGASPDDAAIIQADVPAGSRLYRAVLLNTAKRQSLFRHDAVRNAFDNRLEAAEVRNERYYLKLPPGFSGKVTVEAHLYYRGAPSSFAKRMQVPDFTPVLVASRKKQISVEASHAAKK